MNKEIRNTLLAVGVAAVGSAALTGCDWQLQSPIVNSAPKNPTAGEGLVGLAESFDSSKNVITPESYNSLLSMVPTYPELVKDDPQGLKVPNKAIMLFDSRDSANPLKGLGDKVSKLADSKGWNIMGKLNEWYYPLPIKNGNGETGSDTWAYAQNVIEARNLSVYEKPGVTGQLWFRLPKDVVRGDMVMAFAVNPNFVTDKTGGDPNIVPSVTVRCPNNPGQAIEVVIVDVYKDGRIIARNSGFIGLPKTDTDNLMVNLNPDAITLIAFPVVDQTGNQREGMTEAGSDAKQGPFYNPNLNRSRVGDVAKQLK